MIMAIIRLAVVVPVPELIKDHFHTIIIIYVTPFTDQIGRQVSPYMYIHVLKQRRQQGEIQAPVPSLPTNQPTTPQITHEHLRRSKFLHKNGQSSRIRIQ